VKPRRRVVIESPFRATDAYTTEQHMAYLRAAMTDCLNRGENPIASHLIFPCVLDDDNHFDRALGIQCGLEWGAFADAVAVYRDLGISPGMKLAITHYASTGKPIEYRMIDDATLRLIRLRGFLL
jgi:hypothetical protein